MSIFPGFGMAAGAMGNATTAIQVIGNNMANLSTVGFKKSRSLDRESFSTHLVGGGPSDQLGTGASRPVIQRIFTSGGFQPSDNALDSVIQGNELFILKGPGDTAPVFTRAGTFTISSDRFLVHTSSQKRVQGFTVSENVVGTVLGDLSFAAGFSVGIPSTRLSFLGNFDSSFEIKGSPASFVSDVKRDEFRVIQGQNDQLVFEASNVSGPITANLITDGGLTSGAAIDGATLAAAVKQALEAKNGSIDQYKVTYNSNSNKFFIDNTVDNANSITLRHDDTASNASALLGFIASSSGELLPGNQDVSDLSVAFNVFTGVNDTLSVTIDGVLVNVTIPQGNYTGGGLSRAIELAIEAVSPDFRGVRVTYNQGSAFNRFEIFSPLTGGARTIQQPSNTATPSVPVAARAIAVTGGTLAATMAFDAGIARAGLGGFDINDPIATSSSSSTASVIDSLGNRRLATLFFRKIGDNNWEWHVAFNGEDLAGPTPDGVFEEVASGQLRFTQDGLLDVESTTAGTGILNFSSLDGVNFPDQEQTVTFNFGTSITTDGGTGDDGIVQFSNPFSIGNVVTDGIQKGSLLTIEIDTNGSLIAKFSNGLSASIGQLALARFASPAQLEALGDTLFQESIESGAALITVPDPGGTGPVLSGSLEISNVDIAEEFVELILQQQAFQANSRLITTGNELLQTLVNLT